MTKEMTVSDMIVVLSKAPMDARIMSIVPSVGVVHTRMVTQIHDAALASGGYGVGILLVPSTDRIAMDMVVETGDIVLWNSEDK